tara:strand:- start:1438 stop:1584 length:147 start_codon:yes stop_codon:yes gene_type:complete
MPMGKGTYGSQVGRPTAKKKAAKKSMLTAKQKTLPKALQQRIMKAKMK